MRNLQSRGFLEVEEAEHGKKRRKERAERSRFMCVLVSSSSLIGQPELISPALDSSGQDWVGYCQKHETPSSLPTRPGVTTAPPPHTHPSPLYAPCSDSPRGQSGNTLPADGIIIASK